MNVKLVNTFLRWFSKVTIITCNKINRYVFRKQQHVPILQVQVPAIRTWTANSQALRSLLFTSLHPTSTSLLLHVDSGFGNAFILQYAVSARCSGWVFAQDAVGLWRGRADSWVLYVDWVAPHTSSWAHNINRSSRNTQLTQCGLQAIVYIPITANIFSIHST